MDVIKDKIVTARKAHTCILCGGDINKGEKYENVFFTDNYGEAINSKSHLECAEVCDYLVDYCETVQEAAEEGVTQVLFKDMIEAYIGDNHSKDTEWMNLSIPEKVTKIYNELGNK